MGMLLFGFVVLALAQPAWADTWTRMDEWSPPREMAARNKELREQAERDGQRAAVVRRKNEDDRPAVSSEPALDQGYRLRQEAAFRREISRKQRDPSSVQFRDIVVLGNERVCGFVNAKNSFGVYAGFTLECEVISGR